MSAEVIPVEAEPEPIEFTVSVSIDVPSKLMTLSEEDLREVRRLAEQDDRLFDDQRLLDLVNECIETKILDDWMWTDFIDFDWHGVKQETLFEAIRFVPEMPPPEIPGQISIEDILSELL